MSQDPNYRVEGLPPAIRGKVTQLINAAHDAAWVGSAHPFDMDDIREYEHISRYELERTIMTHLERVDFIEKCVECGRIIDTREESAGGDSHGAETNAGKWVCSSACWEKQETWP